MKGNICIIITLLFLTSCRNNNSVNIPANKSVGFIKDIPTYKQGYASAYYLKKNIADSLRLDYIDDGFDSAQIRLWYGYSKSSYQLFVFKNSNLKWQADKYIFKYFHGKINKDSVILLSHQSESPKRGWDNFIKRLTQLKIQTLPDMLKIKDYPVVFHGYDGVAVEVSTKYYYRFYSYISPEKVSSTIEEAKIIDEIRQLISSEIGFDTSTNLK